MHRARTFLAAAFGLLALVAGAGAVHLVLAGARPPEGGGSLGHVGLVVAGLGLGFAALTLALLAVYTELRARAVRVRNLEADSGIRVRAEEEGDLDAVRAVNAAAFPTPAEADLVDALRRRGAARISLVAEQPGAGIVGHILFSPVEIRASAGVSTALGLAPMAVAPDHQRRGIGSALVEAGLAACRAGGELVVVVLGHPDYYPRFGFRPAWDSGLFHAAPGPNPAFLLRELEPGALAGRSGEVRYHEAFGGL